MSAIRIENLSFCYPGSCDPVFENLNLQLDTSWKLGLIGRNGRGKTTLLNLLMNRYAYTGQILAPAQFECFPHPVEAPNRRAEQVLREICPQAEDWELVCELSRLDVDCAALERPFSQLSGGEQTKMLLAALFLSEGRFPLIDEPTNHLDAAARALVATYLKRKPGFILVSHDRTFLDGCVDHILSINRNGVELQAGNYSSWRLNFDRREAFERAQDARLHRDIDHLKAASRRSAGWSDSVERTKKGQRNSGLKPDKGYIGHKAAKMMQRSKAIEARREQAVAEKSALLKDVEEAEELKLSPLPARADRLAELRDVFIHYDGREVCGPVRLCVRPGDRIALDGRNGSGKSSLLKLAAGADIPHSGTVERASGLVISCVSQDSAQLRGSLFEFARNRGVDPTLLLTILRKLGFSRPQFEADMSGFSAGQKKKVLIAASLCERAHLYIWDEPLNYIDLHSRVQIESLLLRFQPTMLFVEHDRAFRTAIATEIVEL